MVDRSDSSIGEADAALAAAHARRSQIQAMRQRLATLRPRERQAAGELRHELQINHFSERLYLMPHKGE